MKLPYLFTNNALFQADSYFNIIGENEPNKIVKVKLFDKDNQVVYTNETKADENGAFELKVETPKPSFNQYKLVIEGDETKTCDNVLFGELWLASGQSNMELSNAAIPEHNILFEKMQGKTIRFFHVDYQGLCDPEMKSPFPFEPQPYGYGFWIAPENKDLLNCVSALATKFADKVYNELNEKGDIPFGILDASWGGTPITAWIKKTDIDEDPEYAERLKAIGKYPFENEWNSAKTCCNFQQTSSQYNVKIAPLVGAKVRGCIWYQGEHETGTEYNERSYGESLRVYQRTYAKRFAMDPQNFLMISSLIHYWLYGEQGECKLAYINYAFISNAIFEPQKFAFVSNGDLQPVWGQYFLNHPIHPLHKYPLGDRFASIALANVYGKKHQKRPATLKKVTRKGDSLILTFNDACGFRIGDGEYYAPGNISGFQPVKTLYVAGKNAKYLPAEAKILSKNKIEVRCDGIKNPKYVAYGIQSMEPGSNLYSGEYPVTPFFNQTNDFITIQQRPWYDMNNSVCWAERIIDEMNADLFYHPVWYSLPGSEVCCDSAFRFETDKSLRICANLDEQDTIRPVIGAYVREYNYIKLDFDGYKELQMNLYNGKGFDAELVLTLDNGEKIIKFEKVKDIDAGWSLYSANIKALKGVHVKRMGFRFSAVEDKKYYRFVNIEKIRLY